MNNDLPPGASDYQRKIELSYRRVEAHTGGHSALATWLDTNGWDNPFGAITLMATGNVSAVALAFLLLQAPLAGIGLLAVVAAIGTAAGLFAHFRLSVWALAHSARPASSHELAWIHTRIANEPRLVASLVRWFSRARDGVVSKYEFDLLNTAIAAIESARNLHADRLATHAMMKNMMSAHRG